MLSTGASDRRSYKDQTYPPFSLGLRREVGLAVELVTAVPLRTFPFRWI